VRCRNDSFPPCAFYKALQRTCTALLQRYINQVRIPNCASLFTYKHFLQKSTKIFLHSWYIKGSLVQIYCLFTEKQESRVKTWFWVHVYMWIFRTKIKLNVYRVPCIFAPNSKRFLFALGGYLAGSLAQSNGSVAETKGSYFHKSSDLRAVFLSLCIYSNYHSYIYMHIYIEREGHQIYEYMNLYICIYTYIFICMYIFMFTYIYINIYMYKYTYICLRICIYIYTYKWYITNEYRVLLILPSTSQDWDISICVCCSVL